MMSYEPVKQQESRVPGVKEIELEGSETDIEANPPESEDSFFLGWKRRKPADSPSQGLYRKAIEANVPVIVSLHFLVLNLILSIALGSLLWKSIESADIKSEAKFPAGELLYTVGQDVIEHRIEEGYVGPGYSEGWKESPYQGWPTDEKDRLWHHYEDGNHIRLTKDEAAQLHQPTQHVPLEEYKDEYIVGLVIFHHLHCLGALRKALYPKRYNTSIFEDDGTVNYEKWHHLDHCIEILRTYLECHPETTAMSFQWIPESTMAVYPTTLHTCRNFDVISNWAYERSVNVPVRSHLENGRIVDYTDKHFGREYNETWEMHTPEGWAYTREDM